MSVREYIGARYVPTFGRKGEESITWNNTGTYEPLTVVLYQGNSYTSRQYVPAGIEIDNEAYWAETGNYNAQVEQYRQEVLNYAGSVEALKQDVVYSFETANSNDYPNTAMANASTLVAGMICHTNGFYESGDGGAAWYEITSSGTANGKDVIECANSGVYANLIWDKATVNVKQIGAHADNTNSDSDYFYRAIAMILENQPLGTIQRDNPKGGGTVYIPSGTYLIDSSITNEQITSNGMTSNIKFVGENKTNTIINCTAPFINLGAGSAHWNIEVRNLSFTDDAISCISADNMIIENCRFYNAGEYGIRLYLTVNVKITHCYFTNCAIGIVISSVGTGPSTTLDINGCWFSHNTLGIFTQFGSSNGLYLSTIRNSIFEYNDKAFGLYGNSGDYPTRLQINNIHFEGNTNASILNNISVKINDCYFDDALATNDNTLTELFAITTANGNIVEIECDTMSRFTFANKWLGKIYIRDKEGLLLDTLYNNELIVAASTYTIGTSMIETNGTVEAEYMSSAIVAHAYGIFVRGTSLSLQNTLTNTFVSNAQGVIAVTDNSGTNPRLRLKWVSA